MKDETMPPLPEPLDYQFQHEETGLTQTVCGQQVEWGFEEHNPRWKRIGGAFSEAQMHAYARAYAEQVTTDLQEKLDNTLQWKDMLEAKRADGRLARAVVAEREACAITCISITAGDDESWQDAAEACAAAIRSRGTQA